LSATVAPAYFRYQATDHWPASEVKK
jgi:hypothetical protein